MRLFAPTWAIAKMTLLEARRRKVFAILLLFTVALLSSTLFFPSVDIDSRLRLIEVWSLRASALFTAIVALFLAGFSLPTDFEQKRIYLIVTKPVSKSVVFLGRYLGYVLLLALFIGAMGAITVAFLRVVKLCSGDRFPALVAYPRIAAAQLGTRGGEAVSIAGEDGYAVKKGTDDALVWTFRDLKPSHFGPQGRLVSRLLFGALNDKFRSSGTVRVRCIGASGRSHEASLTMNTNEDMEVAFPSDILGPDGVLTVEVLPSDPDGVIGGRTEWLMLYEKPTSFELAFARGLTLVLFQSMIVLSVTLMSSTFLSAPVSILLGILIYVIGSVYGYIHEGTRDLDQSLGEISLDQGKRRTPEDIPESVLRVSNTLSKGVLAVVPDFANFDYSAWLLKDHEVSWPELLGAARKALPPVGVLLVLGTVIMMFKDFDR